MFCSTQKVSKNYLSMYIPSKKEVVALSLEEVDVT